MGAQQDNLNDSLPTPPAGCLNIKWQADAPSLDPTVVRKISAYAQPSTMVAFVINSGIIGFNVGPILKAKQVGRVSTCAVIVKSSDPTIPLVFTIRQNGAAVFTSSPSVAALTSAGTVVYFATLTSVPLIIAANDIFMFDILNGSGQWQFTAQLE